MYTRKRSQLYPDNIKANGHPVYQLPDCQIYELARSGRIPTKDIYSFTQEELDRISSFPPDVNFFEYQEIKQKLLKAETIKELTDVHVMAAALYQVIKKPKWDSLSVGESQIARFRSSLFFFLTRGYALERESMKRDY